MKSFKKHIVSFMLIMILFFNVSSATAGSQAGGEIHFEPERIVKFAKKVEKTLAQKGARVAVVARLGRPRDTLPGGVKYTHVGFAVYSQITTADNRKMPGYAMYNLYQSNEKPDRSDLIQDFPVDFFAGVQVLEAGLIIPTPQLQQRLLEVLASPTYKELHNPRYSVIANPFTLDFQNCTEHTLDVIISAIYQTTDTAAIKANEKAYFKPHPVRIDPIKLFLGSLFSSEVSTRDHEGPIVISTFNSIGQFLTKYGAASEVLTVLPDV
ncbi:MAG: DUF2145 domain-containing protein [Desulfobacteraceae bacterium]|nr:DUF2145 domain-containing protein [Desulfobacteraceae bacterium]